MYDQAEEEERKFDWPMAASHYEQALELESADPSILAETNKRLAFALYMTAMQCNNQDEFRSRINESIERYKRACEASSKPQNLANRAGVEACEAMCLFLASIVAEQSLEKKRVLEESWKHTREAFRIYEESSNALGYLETYRQLSRSIFLLYALEWDAQNLSRILKEAWEFGERAIRLLPSQGHPRTSASIYVITAAILNLYVDNLPDPDDQERYGHKAKEYWRRARELSEVDALLQVSDNPLNGFLFAESAEAITVFEEALKHCSKTRDRLTIGSALDQLAYHTWLIAYATEDPDKKKALLSKALQHALGAREQYSPIRFTSPRTGRFWVEAPESDQLLELSQLETDLENRKRLLNDAVRAAGERLRRAEESGYPLVIRTAHHVLSLALVSLARLESSKSERRRLLEEALAHRNNFVRINERISPFFYWNRGIGLNYTSDIKAELASLTEDSARKKTLLLEAIQAKEECLKLCQHDLPFIERTGSASMILALGQRRLEYGDLLARLYGLTEDTGRIRDAVESFVEAAGMFERTGHKAHMAECYWKAAQGLDHLSDYSGASKNFMEASGCYDQAAGKSTQLEKVYTNNSSYMKAWAAVEEAKGHHEREQYAEAKKEYEKASSTFRSTDRFAIFADSFSAWAEIESGEDLSGKGMAESATLAFQHASSLFKESKRIIQANIARIESSDERELAARLIRAADLRAAYCNVRINLEQARSLARRAEYYSSSGKYGDASAALEKIIQETEHGQTRRELEQIQLLSRAWEKMSRAEGENSSELYGEASRLFDQARGLSLNEKQSSLALANSRFCRALQEGTVFMDTRDPELHAMAVQDLEGAASVYLRAGFLKESEYAKASKLMFEAYVYMENASREKDASRKTQLYSMAEKVLQTAGSSFEKADHRDKGEQVHRLLEKVAQERQLAVSLSELLTPTSTMSAAAATFPAPEPTQERPVGLERLEHADIQAKLTTSETSLEVGENLEVEMELVNAGRGPAQLVKVENIIPEGFETMEVPEPFRVEETYLSMKGKRLNPLKTQKIGLVLRPKVQGSFILRPRVLYLDESGRYKSHETDSIELTVKELGTSGLPEGERKLAAIMFTDMVGYTGLSQKNEALAMELLAEHRKIVRPLYLRHGGREIKTMGDAFLVEFESAVEAVKCALDIQKSLNERNALARQDKRVSVRVGIHVGDVIHSGRDVYGDAVNVASRIEPLAEPGGICVSGYVYESVKNSLSSEFAFESLGLREMKNVANSIMVYRIVLPWQETYPSAPLDRNH